MFRTYELYVRHGDGHMRFEPLTYRGSPLDLLSHVRALLAERGADSIEVRDCGAVLFTLAAGEA